MKRTAPMLAAVVLALTGAVVFGISGPASAASGASPLLCKSSSSAETLETLSRGHSYTCSGWHDDADGETAYYFHAGGWSGVLYTSGADYYFCDNAAFGIPDYTVDRLYMSPVRESWC